MQNPVFSIVIPCYNRATNILKTLKSVKNQSFSNFECIVIDDGSVDSEQLQLVIEGLKDTRFKYIWRKNGGGSAARNIGIDASIGKYIAFLDSDDFFKKNKLQVVYNIAKSFSADVYFSYVAVNRGNGVWARKPSKPLTKSQPLDEYLFCDREIAQTSSLVVRNIVAKSVRFQEGLKKGQDLDFVVRLDKSGATFHFIEESLTVWTDDTYDGYERVSHKKNPESLEKWLHDHKSILSRRAYYGFKANILSFEISNEKPYEAIIDIIFGVLFGGVSIKNGIHSFTRAFLPRKFYKKLVDFYIKNTVTP